MLFGLTGAHRSGKTTLARAVAQDLGLEFYETSVSRTAKEHGYNAVGDMSLTDRLHLQTILLQNHLEEIGKRDRPLIVDRTPLDFMGYLACEFTMTNGNGVDPEVLQQAAIFADKCLETTRAYYDYIFYLAPLPAYVVEDGKPADNPIYQMHHALVVQGGITQLRDTINSALIYDTDWDVRQEFLHDTIVGRLDTICEERRSAAHLN
ncbi:AAA family ATPase [Shinella zoogloeoides]|uniref:AAA family ATPase n=1 Tax=Shinella zoogloeoides TaxID=352475 RepID=UPI00273FD387|nr:AAA family ATPase [Shinella zoogloeoides]WLR90901.1 AAA family ATPase [Shinella zoogloeoides]